MTLAASSPSAEGADADRIAAFVDATEAADLELHSLSIARRGRVIASGAWKPYALDRPALVYSLSKSLTATAIATLIDRGEVALDDPVLGHLPADEIAVDPRWEAVEIRHCLSMTVGHTSDAWDPVMRAASGVQSGRPRPFLDTVLELGPDAEPGTVFCYNQVATYVLSRLVANVTGRPLLALLRERILDPLRCGEAFWQRDPEGYELGFTGAHVRPVDLAAIVQLWADRGVTCDGTRLISEAWYDAATRPFLPLPPPHHLGGDWERGYGYSFWIARHGYRGDGAFGQYGIVLPDHDATITITSEVDDMAAVLDLVWSHLLPAFARRGSIEADARLADRLANLTLPAPASAGSTITVERAPIRFKLTRSPIDAAYRHVEVVPTATGHDVTLIADPAVPPPIAGLPPATTVTIPVGNGDWSDGMMTNALGVLPVAAAGGWDRGRFRATVRVVEVPHRLELVANPTTGRARIEWVRAPLSGPDPTWLTVRPSDVTSSAADGC